MQRECNYNVMSSISITQQYKSDLYTALCIIVLTLV